MAAAAVHMVAVAAVVEAVHNQAVVAAAEDIRKVVAGQVDLQERNSYYQ